LVMYGDTMVNLNIQHIWQAHWKNGSDVTLVVHPNSHPLDSDLVDANPSGWVEGFHNRPHPTDQYFRNLVSAGLYVIKRSSLQPWVAYQPSDFGKDLFPAMLRAGARLLAYETAEYIKDVGTPERYDNVCHEYATGVVQRASLNSVQRAIILDRDGTLVREVDGLSSPEQLHLLPRVAEAIRELNRNGWRTVVVTNQPLVAKGLCSEGDVEVVHRRLETLLGWENAFLDRIYWCPHHPERGFDRERVDLKISCDCRKPNTGLIHRAARDFNLDLGSCWLVGDSTTDVETARNSGLRSILVRTGHAGGDGKFRGAPDLIATDLFEAVHMIFAHTNHDRQ